MEKQIKRGDLYYADLDPTIGSEQDGFRPVLVVQNNIGNAHSPTVVIVPLTTKTKKNNLPTHVLIPAGNGLEEDSTVLTEQIRTIDRSRLGEFIGRLDGRLQTKIDKALAVSIGLSGGAA